MGFSLGLSPPNSTLFAVLDSSCGTSLAYGPSPVDLQGEVGGTHSAYFSTNTSGKDLPHKEWLQIVTTDNGSGYEEIFRVYWTFPEAQTLQGHFTAAVQTPQAVSYRVMNSDGSVFEYEGNWSLQSEDFTERFASAETQVGFITGKVLWGAFEGMADFEYNSYYSDGPVIPIALSGVVNYGTDDRAESKACNTIYQQGKPLIDEMDSLPQGARMYLYYGDMHNGVPATVPDDLTHNVTMRVTQVFL